MLPTGSFEPVGMVGGIADTGSSLLISLSATVSDKQEKKIHGWADAYKDGGSSHSPADVPRDVSRRSERAG